MSRIEALAVGPDIGRASTNVCTHRGHQAALDRLAFPRR